MENRTPPLSIIMSSYNHGKYISDSIGSLLKQSFQDFELVIVDDASTDNTIEVVKRFFDPRIRLINLSKNTGVCNVCNVGIANSKGKYIKFFASDDIASPAMLEKQVNFLDENQEYDAVFSRIEVIDENNNILHDKTKKFDKFFTNINRTREEWLNHFFFKGNCLAAPTAMVRTDLLKKVGVFDLRLAQAHDFDLWVRCVLHGKNAYVIDEKLVQYRRISGDKNLSSNTLKMRKRLVFDNEKVLERYLAISDVEELVKIFPDLGSIKEKLDNSLIPFFLAKQALQAKDSYFHKQFALNIIYKELENSEIVSKLKERFNFVVNKDFYEIVVMNPIGSLLEESQNNFCNKIKRKIRKILS